ncbi:hypothetical protein METBIDRAFT_10272 [Metschnikowia bicuspidata var. bicuspidata NRRL YB-4993]|uniref:Zn(2)-C6 fungal-type domain-containing protein n=1 Tax=Metschnikowia bicuspidata var. bicuspidata NRRL YB-4993 TaxID=869754 RepID=A0A1A0HJV7_9ASCO|nr:hypothetical protein METBIDRAFT_10272 [Metschnikowia bicuspidata var. bicuspidata NRRL YB-4993]OBA24098.1 hypothetical protein METBIDRAFT_10272 [Metschnikowia bicuspidata var. bicuspidata NRRL YB-4993]
MADDQSAAKKAETRSRRSYACGPCKRYKTKCNLETPCLACTSAKRPEECLLNPPNPPSEAEKSRIEKRRRKSSQQKKEARGLRRPGVKNPRSPAHTSAAGSPQNESLGVDLLFPVAPDEVAPPPIRAPHLKDFGFIRRSYQDWARQTMVIPLAEFLRCKAVARCLSYEQLLRYFRRFARWDSDGFQYLVDSQTCFNIASNFLVKVPASADDLDSRTFNALLVRGMSLVFCVVAIGKVLEGDPQTADVCLALAEDFMVLLGEPESLGDFIHLGIFVLVNKTPSLLLSNPLRILRLFKDFTHKMNASAEVLRYLTMTDAAKREKNEEFIAFARVWVLARFAEPDVSVLSAEGSLQLSVGPDRRRILPDPELSRQLFHSHVDVLAAGWQVFDIANLISSRYFQRFENVTDVPLLIHAYLLLYLEMGMVIAPLTSKMYLALQKDCTTVPAVAAYNDAILVLVLVNYFSTRWLGLVKVERPHFPALRFAHYVSTLMSTFNWIEELDFRLFDGSGAIYALVLGNSKNFLFLQMYLQLTHQAVFLVVLAQFRSPLSHLHHRPRLHLPLRTRRLEPFCLIPAVADILAVVEALEEFALSTPILADDPDELLDALQTCVEPLLWQAMTLMLFGLLATCASYVEQLWQLAMQVQSNGTDELYITKDLRLDTAFLRNFETSFEPFRFSQDLAEQYIHDVVDPAMALLEEGEASDTL